MTILDREPWDFRNTPPDHYPLLLLYHPLPSAQHLPIASDQTGGRRPGHILAGRRFSGRNEETQLRLLRPLDHRRLIVIVVRRGHYGHAKPVISRKRADTGWRRRGWIWRCGRKSEGRLPYRLDGWHLDDAYLRVRRHARQRRRVVILTTASGQRCSSVSPHVPRPDAGN
jgi:hypothetical protein